MLDGHGSHCTLDFLEWCHKRRILVAVYPPRSTHRLQPLHVGLFGPLATYYSQALDAHTRQSLGLSSISKREFFTIFYPAFDKTFTEENIRSGWRKTGVEPWDPAQVLKVFNTEASEALDNSSASAASEILRSSCVVSPRATRKIRRILRKGVAAGDATKHRTIILLGDAYLGASARAELAKSVSKAFLSLLIRRRRRGNAVAHSPSSSEQTKALLRCSSAIPR